jgi:hypothetical protein
MVRLFILATTLCAACATAEAASWTREQTNSGTSSFMAEELRGCNEEGSSAARAACREWTRDQLQYYRDDRWRRPNWSQDRWR